MPCDQVLDMGHMSSNDILGYEKAQKWLAL